MKASQAIEILRKVGYDGSGSVYEACYMANSALEKQEGKKPKIVGETEYSFFVECPTCERSLINNLGGEWIAGEKYSYCQRCGQKILWE